MQNLLYEPLLSQEIHQIHLDLPTVDLILFKNSVINQSKVRVNKNMLGKIARPTMYESWTESRVDHLHYDWIDGYPILQENPSKSLLIFDTWGTSSYYHLLIDHIVPVWITREWVKDAFNILVDDVDYFRISKNKYETELNNSQEIFSYFIGKKFLESVNGIYKNIVYGYFFNYRPYLGPKYPQVAYPNYRSWLDKFRSTFVRSNECKSSGPILVPLRHTRKLEWVERFIQKYSNRVNFMEVDFGALTISEQVGLAGSARGIFGCEGAAFANMLFMKSGSLVVPVAREPDRFLFHSTLANYIPHRFKSVLVDSSGRSFVKDDEILKFLEGGDLLGNDKKNVY